MNKTNLVEMLNSGEVEIKFKKSDGTTRVMNATLKDTPILSFQPDTEALSVVDTALDEYRAFRFDTVLEVNGTPVNIA